jgi:hypothetical protein
MAVGTLIRTVTNAAHPLIASCQTATFPTVPAAVTTVAIEGLRELLRDSIWAAMPENREGDCIRVNSKLA